MPEAGRLRLSGLAPCSAFGSRSRVLPASPACCYRPYRSVSRQTFAGNGCRVLHGPVRRYHPYFPTDAARSQWTRRSTPPPSALRKQRQM